MKKLIVAAALLAASPASAGDPLLDFLGVKPAFDAALIECGADSALRDINSFDRVVNCVMRHPNASSYTVSDQRYINKARQMSATVHAGADYGQQWLALNDWRLAQLENRHSQQRLANAVESIPRQQAWWATTLNGLQNNNWQPRMYRNRW